MSVTITTEHGVERRTVDHPEGWSLVETYHPCPTVTPWDYYCMKQAREWCRVLDAKGIPHTTCNTTETSLHPTGTGPGGRVRFGDNMMPGSVALYVPPEHHAAAVVALAEHKQAIRAWLDDGAPMPEACR